METPRAVAEAAANKAFQKHPLAEFHSYVNDNGLSSTSSLSSSFSNLKLTAHRLVLRKKENEEYGFSISHLVIHTSNDNKLKYQVWFELLHF
jgi:hypothetical protein